jgi:threonine/homoserine/homoserine lactone efflux protein
MTVADSLLTFSFAALLLTLTTGLDTALILRTACAEGGRKAIHTAPGTDAGCFICFASGILKRSGVIKVMDMATGGLFLCFAAKLALSTR